MGRARVFCPALQHPGLRLFTVAHRLYAGDETAFLHQQFMLRALGKGKGQAAAP
jgi:hypothetical protein